MLSLHKLVRDALLDDATHSPTLRACLERDGTRAFRYFDRILRSREAYARVGLDLTEFSSLLPCDISSLSTALLVCLSMQRDGYLRQRAVSALAARVEAISLAGVANRIVDPVPQVAEQARDVWTSLLSSSSVRHLVWCLPLIDMVIKTPRGARSGVLRDVDRSMSRFPDLAVAELDLATRSPDQHLRLSAFTHLARLFPDELAPRLALALEDASPPVRLWAGRTALAVVPQHELEPLLRLLADNRSPSLRLLALREYRRRADADRIEAACLDGNANVRFYARRYLRKLHRRVDQRDHALAILTSSAGQTAQLVGALAVLSEFGREQDRPLIETFVRDKRARVAAEAARTLRLLG
ncbi:hypothetical protein WMF20_07200 [Sorangium sp. So ce834]|uniref:HEAT repeat domain-containing protein n=1 Tax=Sorangium sp. So ce834 TaxID=3133321 RepID=UPI003F62B6A1